LLVVLSVISVVAESGVNESYVGVRLGILAGHAATMQRTQARRHCDEQICVLIIWQQ
jgi:hypothetical protein